MTPARRAALKKAQIASARKRKGTGKGKVSSVRRRKGATTATMKRRRKVAAVAAVGAIGSAAGAAYVYKNRERLIMAPEAERRAIKSARHRAGRRLTKAEKHEVRMTERKNHASRSTYRVREYANARRTALAAARLHQKNAKYSGSIRPGRKNGLYSLPGMEGFSSGEQMVTFVGYRRDVHSRANQRLKKMNKKGISATRRGTMGGIMQQRAIKKAKGSKGFGYDSGKRLLVSDKGVVKKAFW